MIPKFKKNWNSSLNNGTMKDDKVLIEEQINLISNAHWDVIFTLLKFMMNDITPGDFNQFSPKGNFKEYFQNKYQVKLKQ